jgi:hypothetical protein
MLAKEVLLVMIPINNLKQTCTACPSQWEFRTYEDRPVYVRFRWGYLSIRIGNPGCDIMNAVNSNEVIGEQISDGLDGIISWKEVEKRIEGLQAI